MHRRLGQAGPTQGHRKSRRPGDYGGCGRSQRLSFSRLRLRWDRRIDTSGDFNVSGPSKARYAYVTGGDTRGRNLDRGLGPRQTLRFRSETAPRCPWRPAGDRRQGRNECPVRAVGNKPINNRPASLYLSAPLQWRVRRRHPVRPAQIAPSGVAGRHDREFMRIRGQDGS
jgi:hypothetical protein